MDKLWNAIRSLWHRPKSSLSEEDSIGVHSSQNAVNYGTKTTTTVSTAGKRVNEAENSASCLSPKKGFCLAFFCREPAARGKSTQTQRKRAMSSSATVTASVPATPSMADDDVFSFLDNVIEGRAATELAQDAKAGKKGSTERALTFSQTQSLINNSSVNNAVVVTNTPSTPNPRTHKQEQQQSNAQQQTAVNGGQPTTQVSDPASNAQHHYKSSAARSLTDYELLAYLGCGSFAEVTLARHRATRRLFAIKKISKQKVQEEGCVERTFTERELLASLFHPFLVGLHQAFQSTTHLYLVLDFAQGGDLFSFLESKAWDADLRRVLKRVKLREMQRIAHDQMARKRERGGKKSKRVQGFHKRTGSTHDVAGSFDEGIHRVMRTQSDATSAYRKNAHSMADNISALVENQLDHHRIRSATTLRHSKTSARDVSDTRSPETPELGQTPTNLQRSIHINYATSPCTTGPGIPSGALGNSPYRLANSGVPRRIKAGSAPTEQDNRSILLKPFPVSLSPKSPEPSVTCSTPPSRETSASVKTPSQTVEIPKAPLFPTSKVNTPTATPSGTVDAPPMSPTLVRVTLEPQVAAKEPLAKSSGASSKPSGSASPHWVLETPSTVSTAAAAKKKKKPALAQSLSSPNAKDADDVVLTNASICSAVGRIKRKKKGAKQSSRVPQSFSGNTTQKVKFPDSASLATFDTCGTVDDASGSGKPAGTEKFNASGSLSRSLTQEGKSSTRLHRSNRSLHSSNNNKPTLSSPSMSTSCGIAAFQTASDGRMPISHIYFYAVEIALVLNYLHKKGFVYRDLKPENILMDDKGNLMLTDFGVAKFRRGNMPRSTALQGGTGGANKNEVGDDRTSSFTGTAQYMSPEMLKGEPHDSRTDWWSFGCLLFEMCNNRRPFEDDNEYRLYKKIVESAVDVDYSKDYMVSDVEVNWRIAQLHSRSQHFKKHFAAQQKHLSMCGVATSPHASFDGSPRDNVRRPYPDIGDFVAKSVNSSIGSNGSQLLPGDASFARTETNVSFGGHFSGFADNWTTSFAKAIGTAPLQRKARERFQMRARRELTEAMSQLNDLIDLLLTKDMNRRISGESVLEHPFFSCPYVLSQFFFPEDLKQWKAAVDKYTASWNADTSFDADGASPRDSYLSGGGNWQTTTFGGQDSLAYGYGSSLYNSYSPSITASILDRHCDLTADDFDELFDEGSVDQPSDWKNMFLGRTIKAPYKPHLRSSEDLHYFPGAVGVNGVKVSVEYMKHIKEKIRQTLSAAGEHNNDAAAEAAAAAAEALTKSPGKSTEDQLEAWNAFKNRLRTANAVKRTVSDASSATAGQQDRSDSKEGGTSLSASGMQTSSNLMAGAENASLSSNNTAQKDALVQKQRRGGARVVRPTKKVRRSASADALDRKKGKRASSGGQAGTGSVAAAASFDAVLPPQSTSKEEVPQDGSGAIVMPVVHARCRSAGIPSVSNADSSFLTDLLVPQRLGKSSTESSSGRTFTGGNSDANNSRTSPHNKSNKSSDVPMQDSVENHSSLRAAGTEPSSSSTPRVPHLSSDGVQRNSVAASDVTDIPHIPSNDSITAALQTGLSSEPDNTYRHLTQDSYYETDAKIAEGLSPAEFDRRISEASAFSDGKYTDSYAGGADALPRHSTVTDAPTHRSTPLRNNGSMDPLSEGPVNNRFSIGRRSVDFDAPTQPPTVPGSPREHSTFFDTRNSSIDRAMRDYKFSSFADESETPLTHTPHGVNVRFERSAGDETPAGICKTSASSPPVPAAVHAFLNALQNTSTGFGQSAVEPSNNSMSLMDGLNATCSTNAPNFNSFAYSTNSAKNTRLASPLGTNKEGDEDVEVSRLTSPDISEITCPTEKDDALNAPLRNSTRNNLSEKSVDDKPAGSPVTTADQKGIAAAGAPVAQSKDENSQPQQLEREVSGDGDEDGSFYTDSDGEYEEEEDDEEYEEDEEDEEDDEDESEMGDDDDDDVSTDSSGLNSDSLLSFFHIGAFDGETNKAAKHHDSATNSTIDDDDAAMRLIDGIDTMPLAGVAYDVEDDDLAAPMEQQVPVTPPPEFQTRPSPEAAKPTAVYRDTVTQRTPPPLKAAWTSAPSISSKTVPTPAAPAATAPKLTPRAALRGLWGKPQAKPVINSAASPATRTEEHTGSLRSETSFLGSITSGGPKLSSQTKGLESSTRSGPPLRANLQSRFSCVENVNAVSQSTASQTTQNTSSLFSPITATEVRDCDYTYPTAPAQQQQQRSSDETYPFNPTMMSNMLNARGKANQQSAQHYLGYTFDSRADNNFLGGGGGGGRSRGANYMDDPLKGSFAYPSM